MHNFPGQNILNANIVVPSILIMMSQLDCWLKLWHFICILIVLFEFSKNDQKNFFLLVFLIFLLLSPTAQIQF
jgi:hypothetical protein